MKESRKTQAWWLLIIIGSLIPLTFILETQFDISKRITIPLVVVAALIFGAMAIWMRANSHARGDEWWQDEDSSGWHGY